MWEYRQGFETSITLFPDENLTWRPEFFHHITETKVTSGGQNLYVDDSVQKHHRRIIPTYKLLQLQRPSRV